MRCFFYRPIYLNEQISFFAYYENKKIVNKLLKFKTVKKMFVQDLFFRKNFSQKN